MLLACELVLKSDLKFSKDPAFKLNVRHCRNFHTFAKCSHAPRNRINRWAASAILTFVEIEHKVDWGFCFLVFFAAIFLLFSI